MNRDKIASISIKTPEKPEEKTIVTVNDQTFTASTQSGAISQALDSLGEPTTPENIVEFIELFRTNAQTGEYVGISSEDVGVIHQVKFSESPVKKKRKAKAEKKPENELVGKLFLGEKGELLQVVSVTPPADWQFELEYLDTDCRGETRILGLREFKELIPLVPKHPKKKEEK